MKTWKQFLEQREYGRVIGHSFRCPLCAEGSGEEGEPVLEEPPLGHLCTGCGQVYLGDHKWGGKSELPK